MAVNRHEVPTHCSLTDMITVHSLLRAGRSITGPPPSGGSYLFPAAGDFRPVLCAARLSSWYANSFTSHGFIKISEVTGNSRDWPFRNVSDVPCFPADIKTTAKESLGKAVMNGGMPGHELMSKVKESVGSQTLMQVDLRIETIGVHKVPSFKVEHEEVLFAGPHENSQEVLNLLQDPTMCNFSTRCEAIISTKELLDAAKNKCSTPTETIPVVASSSVSKLAERNCKVWDCLHMCCWLRAELSCVQLGLWRCDGKVVGCHDLNVGKVYTAIIELKDQNDNPIRIQGAPLNITPTVKEISKSQKSDAAPQLEFGAAAAAAICASQKANGTCEIVLQPKEPGYVRLCVQMNEQKISLDHEVLRLTAQPKSARNARALPNEKPQGKKRPRAREGSEYGQGIGKPIFDLEQKKQQLHSCLVDSPTVVTSG